ncbi:hypothetical protein EC957_006494 [Mortierella hygrophila]|uniref:Uncharacterized protein n=1 Tax=Mortierella hygrophila TaxID=979708 RepID=A0A9P6K885_9FUNG|nr:hypothetical protein EC957_006494 [Mortierella hygrophila]
MAPKSITNSSNNNSPPSTSDNSNNTIAGTSSGSGASSFHSRHGSTISILSVPLLDPFYRDLVALKTDHTALYAELKRTQQTLQLSYQDLMMAQERSKRAETDSGRLKSQMETIFKRHVDHHPEREALVQQLAELQTRLDIELGARRVLEQEHSLLQHELIRCRLNNSNENPPSSSSTSSTAVATAAQSNPSSSSPVGSIRSATFALFSGGGSRKSTRSSIINSGTGTGTGSNNNNSNDRTPSIRSVRMTDEIQSMQESSSPAPPRHSNHYSLLSAPSTPRTTSNYATSTSASTPPPPPATPAQQQYEGGVTIIQDLDHENLAAIQSRLPSLEQLEGQRLFYDKLAEENVAMKMEIQDLRYRNKAEKDSIKGYMSLFESLQKKQSNALAVAQAEIDLLRSTIQEHTLRLESRETLLQTFAATVNSQAIELEILTRDTSRERTARAKIEQEMASLLEASLLMLERLFANVDQTVRSGLVRVLDPIRQTIHHLEIPSILQEWDMCEQGVQRIVNDLARSLVYQQEVQERGLEAGGDGDGAGSSRGSTGSALVKASNNTSNSSSSSPFGGNNNNGARNPRNSVSSTHSAMTAYSTYSTSGNNTYRSYQEESPEESMLILNNNFSQQVLVWRKFTADTFLEECVKSVEDLAQERRELQTRVVELTRIIVEQDEARRLKEISASHEGGSEVEGEEQSAVEKESVVERTDEKEKEKEETMEDQEKGDTAMDDKEDDASNVAIDLLTPETNLSSDTPRKDSKEDTEELSSVGGYCTDQENHSKDWQESSHPLNTIDHQNRASGAGSAEEGNSREMTRRLELILQKVLDHLESSKEKVAATMDKVDTSGVAIGASPRGLNDDDILSLGISEAPVRVMKVEMSTVQDAKPLLTTMSCSGSSTIMANSDVSRPKGDDLETLVQLIRHELTGTNIAPSTEASALDANAIDASPIPTMAPLQAVEIEDVVVVDTGEQEKLVDMELLYIEPPTAEPATTATTLTIITTDTSANELANNSTTSHTRTQTRPEGISTSSLALACRISSSSTASTPTTSLASASTVSSASSNSSYFFSSTKLGSLSTPSSPSLGGIGGPDGQTLLDVEALCRDLAFRSFPTQHQWSKKSKKQPPVWYPASSTFSSAGASGLPPRPPLPSSTSQH